MDRQDLRQRIIGLLTLAYGALHELERGDGDEEFAREFGNTVDSLMEGWSASYAIDVDVPPAYALNVQAALQRFSKEMSSDVNVMFGIFTGLFVRLCQDIEDAFPEADIPSILHAIALEASEDE